MNSKPKVLSIAAGLAMFTAVAASAVPSTLTQNSTWNLTSSAQSFTFNKFNPTMGTLTAVDLIFNSATLTGGITLQAVTSPRTITGFENFISVSGAGITTSIETTPIAVETTGNKANIPTSGRTFTVNASQSAVSAPATLSLIDEDPTYTSFIGAGSFSFNSYLDLNPTGSLTALQNLIETSNTFASVASVTLQYSYTAGPSPIPEPGQVAASLLLLSGVGAYVFIKRRKKFAPAAA